MLTTSLLPATNGLVSALRRMGRRLDKLEEMAADRSRGQNHNSWQMQQARYGLQDPPNNRWGKTFFLGPSTWLELDLPIPPSTQRTTMTKTSITSMPRIKEIDEVDCMLLMKLLIMNVFVLSNLTLI